MTTADAVLSNPLTLAAITVAILTIIQYQRTLSTREVLAVATLKALVFPRLNPLAERRGRPLIREAGQPQADPDFVTSLPVAPREVIRELRPPFEPQLLSTAKYREADDGRQYAHSQWVYYHEDGHQTHVYLFRDGEDTDVYAHVEPAVYLPADHHLAEQQAGDDRGAVRQALGL